MKQIYPITVVDAFAIGWLDAKTKKTTTLFYLLIEFNDKLMLKSFNVKEGKNG